MRERQDMIIANPGNNPAGLAQYAPRPNYGPALPSEAPEASLLKPILRRWWLVLLFTLIGAAGAFVYIKSAQRLFTSQAKIYIQPTSEAVNQAIGALERANYLATQVEVIRSSTILSRVAETDGIRGLKTFLPAKGNPVLFLRDELTVDLERKTDLIVVSLNSAYPEEAAQIVSAVVNAYNDYCTESRNDRSNSILKSLNDNLAKETKKADESEQKLTAFKRLNGAVSDSPDGQTELAGLAAVSGKLTAIQMQLVEARATYSPEAPSVKRLEAQVKDLTALYEQEMSRAAKLQSKGAELQRLKIDSVRQRDYVTKLESSVRAREMDLGGRKKIDIEVMEPARVSEFPSFPRKNRIFAIALVLGCLLGCGLALLRDRMDGRMRSVEEIQTVVGLPILGVVPAMSGRRTAVARAMTVHLDPRSVVAEAYRTIRTAVYFGVTSGRSKTLLVTSPEPGDGKTTSASNLAIAIAQTGRSVLLLDADFRKPTQHKNLDIKDAVGLSSVLAGREPLERAIQRTGVEGLDILPCGPIPANPSEILNSREFGELIDSLASRYDHIIFDSPPVNSVTDARILGAVCDATILVMRADKSTRKAGEHARNSLLSVGARVLGAIVNDAPRGKSYEVYGGSYYGNGGGSGVPTTRLTTSLPHDQNNRGNDPPRKRDIA